MNRFSAKNGISRIYHSLILIVFALFLSPDLAAVKGIPDDYGYQYIFPPPSAKYVNPLTTIIVRFDHMPPNRLINLSGMIQVEGKQSGRHYGRTIIASDKKTVVFESGKPFDAGETVTVSINPDFPAADKKSVKPVTYSFSVAVPPASTVIPPDIKRADTSPQTRAVTAGAPRIMPNGVSVPGDFPHVTISEKKAGASDKYIFLNNWGPPNFNIIFDTDGSPVWYMKTESWDRRRDFKVQHNGLISMLVRGNYGGGEGYIVFDENFTLLTPIAIRPAVGDNGYQYYSDEHGMQILEDSGYILIGRHESTVDMSQYVDGGKVDATVRETCIQEFTPEGVKILEFRAWDHLDIREWDCPDENLYADYIRFSHMNAVEVDKDDGNLLISSRHISEITKIDRQTGEIIWRMCGLPGSSYNQFEFIDDEFDGFRCQHDIRSLGNNRYTLFDNGNHHSPPTSRAVEYEIDTSSMTATLKWEHQYDGGDYSYYMGNAQRLDNGNTHINWAVGSNMPIATEVTPDGDKVFEMWFNKGYHSYRTFRFPWNGVCDAPYLMLEPEIDRLTLIFNKFGDQNVDHYKIYGNTFIHPTTAMDTSGHTMKSFPNLENGKHYWFRVTAVYEDGTESPYSNEEEITVNITEPGANLISNGDFSEGMSDWTWEVRGSAEASWEIKDGVNHISVAQGGNNYYEVQLRQNGIPLVEDREYVFEFDAWADDGRLVEIKVGEDDDPWTNYSKLTYTWLTSDPEHFTYPFKMEDPTDYNARVVLNAGISTQDVYIDNLELRMKMSSDVKKESQTATRFRLYPNYPNPFNPVTSIQYELPERCCVKISIYNVQGQEISVLQDGIRNPGLYTTRFDASGHASGLYFYKMAAHTITGDRSFQEVRKMILIQ